MKNIFLTEDESSKKEFKKIIKQTAKAITEAFNDSTAYSGPTPQELKQIVHQDSILPETGFGWKKVLKLTKKKILPNLLRTSRNIRKYCQRINHFYFQPVNGQLGSGACCNRN